MPDTTTITSPADRLVLEPERRKMTAVPRASWQRLEASGLAPRRRQIGPRRVAWLASELHEWMRSRPVVPAAAGAGDHEGV